MSDAANYDIFGFCCGHGNDVIQTSSASSIDVGRVPRGVRTLERIRQRRPRIADETGVRVHVSHFPPGTSKWNKIEHRLFCHITHNWRGKPMRTFETIVDLIGNTRRSRQLIVHKFCLYRHRTDSSCFVPDPLYFARPQPYRAPVLVEPEQVARMLACAAAPLPRRTRRCARRSCAWRSCSCTQRDCAAAKYCV